MMIPKRGPRNGAKSVLTIITVRRLGESTDRSLREEDHPCLQLSSTEGHLAGADRCGNPRPGNGGLRDGTDRQPPICHHYSVGGDGLFGGFVAGGFARPTTAAPVENHTASDVGSTGEYSRFDGHPTLNRYHSVDQRSSYLFRYYAVTHNRSCGPIAERRSRLP